jgi:hypothetical protein
MAAKDCHFTRLAHNVATMATLRVFRKRSSLFNKHASESHPIDPLRHVDTQIVQTRISCAAYESHFFLK